MASGTCGDNLTWMLDNGTLTISGNIYVSANPLWRRYRASITKVVIKDGVTTIGERAFSECLNLTSVVIPDSITTIGEGTFNACKSLTSVVIPDSVKAISGWAFSGCKSLTSVVIPASVKAIGLRVFDSCTSLEKIYYKGGFKIAFKSLKVGNNAKLIPYQSKSPAQVKPPAQIKPPAANQNSGWQRDANGTLIYYPSNSTPAQVEPPAQVKPPAETNCTVYRNTTISRAENIAPPNTKSWSRVDENIAEIRRAAELVAMNIVMTIERDLGFSPEDVSSQNLGYDIKSTSRDGKTLRLIEVKGRRIDAETVTVSRSEIAAALNNPDNFIIAIVRLDGDKNETIYIRKPFEHPPDRAAFSVNFSIQELVEFKSN